MKLSTNRDRKLLAAHKHTGRRIDARHTSWSLVLFIILIVGVLLAKLTASVNADVLTVSAAVHGTPPSQPAEINSPANGSVVSQIPIDVSGTCPADDFVHLDRNGSFSGSAICSTDGTFSLQTDLDIGANSLQARIFNNGGAEGPASQVVTVTYTPPVSPTPPPPVEQPPATPPPVTPPAATGTTSQPPAAATPSQTAQQAQAIQQVVAGLVTQLKVTANAQFDGYRPGETVVWPIDIEGGTAPYSASINWGDGTTDLQTLTSAGSFNAFHTYKKAGAQQGSYVIKITSSDSQGQLAHFQMLVLVNNAATPVVISGVSDTAILQSLKNLKQQLIYSWPLFGTVALMFSSFWLGEAKVKGYLFKSGLIGSLFNRSNR